MSVRSEEPPGGSKLFTRGSKYHVVHELVAKALANRDEWFGVDIPEDMKPTNVWSSVRAALYTQLDGIDIAVRDGTVYLRIKENL